MGGTSKRNRKKRNIAVSYQCPSNILPRDIWVRIATKVASNSIKDLFNMQASCKLFLDPWRSDTVYKHALMLDLLIASFLYYYDRPEKSFIDCCAEAGNPAALLRVGMIDFVWIGHCISGMDTLSMAATGGDVEACYFCAMLLLSHGKEDEEHL
ncbi:F-box protein At2g35280-like [Arachis hypogaea]|uniref:F-box protein At2g35280-like n=1 Tax=Arachis hypogaea TaxID=3818 RepID=UPI0007AFE0D0|nr:uncharacterized protein LOC112747840 [Arachis hypogaea]